MAWGWTRAVEGNEPGCGAGCGDRPGTESTLKAKRPRGVVFHRLLSAATLNRNQEAGMAIFPCAEGLCSFFFFTTQVAVDVGSGVSMGPLSAGTQPPPSSADSAWLLTHNSGFGLQDGRTDGRTDGRNRPPLPNPPSSSNRKPQRNSDLDFRLFAVSKTRPLGYQGAMVLKRNGRCTWMVG